MFNSLNGFKIIFDENLNDHSFFKHCASVCLPGNIWIYAFGKTKKSSLKNLIKKITLEVK